jgi:sugar/nucleoside kinase (ribokinase family)
VDLVHLGYLLLLDTMDQSDSQFKTVAARFLHEIQLRNIKTSIDLVSEESDRYSQIVIPALAYTNFCIINDFEAQKLSGVTFRDGDKLLTRNISKAARTVLDYGVNEMVVVHFPEGACLVTRHGLEILQPSLEIPHDCIAGTAGAGDSFCAGMLYGINKGWSHDKSLRFAVCAGGMNLSDLTTTGGIRSWEEVFAMEKKFPYRTNVF